MVWMVQRRVAEQRVNGRESRVAGGHAVAPLISRWSRNVAITSGRGRRAQLADRPSHGWQGEQQPERVPVGGNRVRAGVSLADQPIGEETLQHGGEERHAAPVSSRRAQARAINSGAVDKYQ